MKNLEEIKQWLVQHKSLLQERYQVRELGIFGSYVRQEQTETSDVDVLVEFSETPSFSNQYQDHLNQVYKTRSDYITGNDPHTLDGSGSATPTFSGYSNSDGTYHWDSDNTDRDPQIGAIVRRW